VGENEGLDVNNAGNAGVEVEDVEGDEEAAASNVTPDNLDSDSL
jgi:hypothetical protein